MTIVSNIPQREEIMVILDEVKRQLSELEPEVADLADSAVPARSFTMMLRDQVLYLQKWAN